MSEIQHIESTITSRNGVVKCKHCEENIKPKTPFAQVPLKYIKGTVEQIGQYKYTHGCGKQDTCKRFKKLNVKKCNIVRSCSDYDIINVKVVTVNICMKCKEEFEQKQEADVKDTEYFVHLYYFLLNGIFSYYKESDMDGNGLPQALITRLYDWRNGSYRGKLTSVKNMSRTGYPFEVICEAFLMSMPNIDYAFKGKSFKNENQKINYICAIVESSLYDTYETFKIRKIAKIKAEADKIVNLDDRVANDDNFEEQIEKARQRKSGQEFKPKDKLEDKTEKIEYDADALKEFSDLFDM